MKKMTIAKKIMLGVGVVVTINVAIAVVNNLLNFQIKKSTEASIQVKNEIEALSSFRYHVAQLNLDLMDAIVDSVSRGKKEVRPEIEKSVNDFFVLFDSKKESFRKILIETTGNEALVNVTIENMEKVRAVPPALFADIRAGKLDNLGRFDETVDAGCEGFIDAATGALENRNQETQNLMDKVTHDNNLATTTLVLGLFLSLIGGFIVNWILVRSVGKDMSFIADKLTDNSKFLNTTSNALSDASQKLSSSSTEQAASLQETMAAMEEISSMVLKSSEYAAKSSETSVESQKNLTRGQEAVTEMIRAVEDIKTSNDEVVKEVENSNHQIAEIVKVISEIGAKTKVINDIVFQTKLLSFNASVEAARAGEHGKGFAVVAEEVGNLAQMSGNAAREISDMLSASTTKVEEIVSTSKQNVDRIVVQGKRKVEAGSETAKRCGEMLDAIMKSAQEVNQMVTEIAAASKEQAQGVSEVKKAITQMDSATQQNNSIAADNSESSMRLKQESESMEHSVAELRALIGLKAGDSQTRDFVVMEKPAPKKEKVEAAPVSIAVPIPTPVVPPEGKKEAPVPIAKMPEKKPVEKLTEKKPIAAAAKKPAPAKVAKKQAEPVPATSVVAAAAKEDKEPRKILQFRKKAKPEPEKAKPVTAKAKSETAPVKVLKAVGDSSEVPHSDDPRFEDV